MWIAATGAAPGTLCVPHTSHIFLFLLNKRAPPLVMSTLAELIQPVRLPSRLMISYHVSSCVIVAPCARALPSLDRRSRPRFPGLFYPIGPPACSLPSLCSLSAFASCLCAPSSPPLPSVDAAAGPWSSPSLRVVRSASLPLSFAFGFDFPFPSMGLMSSLLCAAFFFFWSSFPYPLLPPISAEFVCSFVAATYDEQGQCKPRGRRMMGMVSGPCMPATARMVIGIRFDG
jgi:hypothetical protein